MPTLKSDRNVSFTFPQTLQSIEHFVNLSIEFVITGNSSRIPEVLVIPLPAQDLLIVLQTFFSFRLSG